MTRLSKLPILVFLIAICLVAPIAGPQAAQAAAQLEPPKQPRGLWLEYKQGATAAMAMAGYSMGLFPSSNFLIGYRFGNVVLGAQMGVSWSKRTTTETSNSVSYDGDGVSVSLIPTLQVHLLHRGPLALYLQVGAGVGYNWYRMKSQEMRDESVTALVNAGVGARYFLHPRFALGVEVGLLGTYAHSLWRYDDSGSVTNSWSVGLQVALTAAVTF